MGMYAPEESINDLLSFVLDEFKRYQLSLNFSNSPVLKKIVTNLLKLCPTTAIKKVAEKSAASEFILSEDWLHVIVNGKDKKLLSEEALMFKRRQSDFIALEIQEISGVDDKACLYLTRCDQNREDGFIRTMYILGAE